MAPQQGYNYEDSYGAGSETRFSGEEWYIPPGGYTGPLNPQNPTLGEAKVGLRVVLAYVAQCPKTNLLKNDEKYLLGRLHSILECSPDRDGVHASLIFQPPNLSEAQLAINAFIIYTGNHEQLREYRASQDRRYSLQTIKGAFINYTQGIPYER